MGTKEDMIRKCEYRLSELNAKDGYDYHRIRNENGIFLPCEFELEKEMAVIAYNIEGKEEFAKISKESRLTKLKALIDIGNFKGYWERYVFPITPDNLYYDMYGKVFVMFRDIRNLEDYYADEYFLERYKALIGCTLSAKYSYEDYFQGGLDLLKKDKFLVKIAGAENWEDVVALLQKEEERVRVYHQEKRVEVNRSSYRFKKVMTVISFILTGVLGLFTAYYLLWVKPYDKGVIQAQNAYLDMNYTGVIENLQQISPKRMDNYQKYILATSYVKCESLTDEQKTNILASVEMNGNEKILDYWISIGRLDVENAENIAQQISDDQLLLYAYLKEKYVLEANVEISGEEKTAQLKILDDKIKSLAGEENTGE